MLRARPIVEDFASGITSYAGSVSGDQFALREALFKHRQDVPQVTFDDTEVCRYRPAWKMPCETTRASGGCAVHHMPRMGSLKFVDH